MPFPYEDIVNLPHPESKTHQRMSMINRAAQFAPFAALTGHDSAISETARITSARRDLSATELQDLSRKLSYALSLPGEPLLSITYFLPDSRKSGGRYVTVQGSVKKVETVFNILTLADGTIIPLDAVTDISGEIFNDIDL